MSKKYKHLDIAARIVLYEQINKGTAVIEIASMIGCHKATIYRELERNSSKYGYRPEYATRMYDIRRMARYRMKLDKNPQLKQLVIDRLAEGWSPELITGHININAGRTLITCSTIYRYIYSNEGKAQKLYKLLQKKRKYRYPRIKRKRAKIKAAAKTSIHDRPQEISDRSTFGHYEGDLMLFSKTKYNLLTIRERKSRYIMALKNNSKNSKDTSDLIIKNIKKHYMMKSLTLDNGTEFAQHQKIAEQLECKIYFCDPYKPYQKGAVENANTLIRTMLPRSSNIDDISQDTINSIIDKFNNRPMKCLNFKTPSQIFKSSGLELSP